MNNENLKRGNPDTQFKSGRNAVENGRKGGIANGEACRMRKSMLKILSLPLKSGDVMGIEEMQSVAEANGVNLTVEDAINLAQAIKAFQKKDTKAAEYCRDTSGQKPTDKVEIATVDREKSLEELNKIFDEAVSED